MLDHWAEKHSYKNERENGFFLVAPKIILVCVIWLTKDQKKCCIICFSLWRKVILNQGKLLIWLERNKKKKLRLSYRIKPRGLDSCARLLLRPCEHRKCANICNVELDIFLLAENLLPVLKNILVIIKFLWTFKYFLWSTFSHFLNR